jgi:hypothetical protein
MFKHVGPVSEASMQAKLMPAIERAKSAPPAPAPTAN